MKKFCVLLVCFFLTGLLFGSALGFLNLVEYLGGFVPDIVKQNAYLVVIFMALVPVFIRAKMASKNQDQ